MVFKMKHNWPLLTALLLAVMSIYSCSPDEFGFTPTPSPGRTETEPSVRVPVPDYNHVFIIYSMGYNNLASYLNTNINDILRNPISANPRDVVLILSHLSKTNFDYSTPTRPSLTQVSQNLDGSIQKDTLMILPETTITSSPEVMDMVLTYIHENFNAESYGMLMSSHGSGWVPAEYFTKASSYEKQSESNDQEDTDGNIEICRQIQNSDKIQNQEPYRARFPLAKSIGAHYDHLKNSKEIEIKDLAASIPFKLDYLIFDACLMGGVEVAYELRHITDRIIFSQTEILADGMHYPSLCGHLFAKGGPDLESVCKKYYEIYDKQSGTYKSATISLIDCTKLEALSEITQEIISQHRNEFAALQNNRDNIQKYFCSPYTSNQKWYYDFEDIIIKCGLTEEESSTFGSALEDVVIYKAATPRFMNNLTINTHSGLSMYLPFTTGRDYLNSFYKKLEWNKATGLIQ